MHLGSLGRGLLCAAIVLLSACNLSPYTLGDDDGGDDNGDGGQTIDANGTGGDGHQANDGGNGDGCVPFPETCNGLDDDCDGTADNGFVEHFDSDPAHCGDCDTACF